MCLSLRYSSPVAVFISFGSCAVYIRKSLPTDARCTVAVAFIASRVDYCNGLLYGVSAAVIRRLQMVLNTAARFVVGAGKFQHTTPVLRDVLHWLPVRQRILYKVAATAFDCIRGVVHR